MAVRMGEMMVVVRAQDFASRTLRRVSGELAGMSKAQMLGRQQMQLQAGQAQNLARLARASSRAADVRLIEDQVAAQTRLASVQQRLSKMRAPGWTVAGKQALAAEAALNAEIAERSVLIEKLSPTVQKLATDEVALGVASQEAAAGLQRANMAVTMGVQDTERLAVAQGMLKRERLHDFGQALGGIGRTMQLFGAVGVVAFGLMAKSAADFNSEITLAATQTRDAGAGIEQTLAHAQVLNRQLLGQMKQFPASAKEMSQSAYDIYSSMDVSFGQGQKLLRDFNKVAVAGGTDLGTATTATISILENFAGALQKPEQIMNRMFATVRYGRMNFAQFNSMLSQVVPAAKGAQQSFDDVSGAMAFLTRRIPSQQRASTALARLLDVFTDPDFQAGMAKAGRAITDVSGKLLPFPEIIKRIQQLHPEQLNRVIQVITAVGRGQGRGREFTIQARRALTLLIDGYGEYARVQRNVVNDNEEFGKSYAAMARTAGVQWKVFMNNLHVAAIQIGSQVLPVFNKIFHSVESLIAEFQKLPGGMRHTLVMWLAWGSVLTLLAGVILAVVAGLTTLATAIGPYTARVAGLGAAFRGVEGDAASLEARGAALIGVMKGLAAIGTIFIGIELMRQGGNWKYLGAILAAAGIGLGLGGLPGAAVGATIAVGIELHQVGGMWGSVIGNALMAGALGFARGGPIGATVAVGASIAFSGLSQAREQDKRLKAVQDMQGRIQHIEENGAGVAARRATNIWIRENKKGGLQAGLTAADAYVGAVESTMTQLSRTRQALTTLGVSPQIAAQQARRAWVVFNNVSKERGVQAGQQAAQAYLRGYLTTWARSHPQLIQALQVRARSDPQIEKFLNSLNIGLSGAADKAKRVTLTNAVRDTKTFNQLLAEANAQLKAGRDNAEMVAKALGAAVMRGNFAAATKLLSEYANLGQQKVTPDNVFRLIQEAVRSGHPEKIVDIMKEYSDAARQATQDTKQFYQDMKRYQQDVARYNEQLQQTIQSTTQDTVNSLKGFYDQLYQANQDAFGALMQGPFLGGEAMDLAKEWGIEPGLSDITKDLNAQTRQFKERFRDIRTLTKRGIPAAALQGMLAGMSPEDAVSLLRNLMKASPKQIKAFQSAWTQSQTVITRQTKVDFTQRINQFRKAGISMAEAIKNGFSQEMLSDRGLGSWIKKTFPGIIQDAVDAAVRDFRKQTPRPQRPQRPAHTTRDYQHPGHGNVRVDNSTHVTVNNHGGGGPHTHANSRRQAFVVANAVKRTRRVRYHGETVGTYTTVTGNQGPMIGTTMMGRGD